MNEQKSARETSLAIRGELMDCLNEGTSFLSVIEQAILEDRKATVERVKAEIDSLIYNARHSTPYEALMEAKKAIENMEVEGI